MARVLITDSDTIIREILKTELERNGFKSLQANNALEALELCQTNQIDAAIIDFWMPKFNGLYLLQEIRKQFPNIVVMMISSHASVRSIVSAIKMGADDYLEKPFDNAELIERLRQFLNIKQKKLHLSNQNRFNEIIADNSDIDNVQIKTMIMKVKDLNTNILITGESGTGKSYLAKEIHRLSNRSNLPFVHVDCAALPQSLIENELFGHEKGAFTNAIAMQKGKFELAGKGTIFLDEIGALPLGLQPKLLNVIQERYVYRVGGTSKIPIEARLIAATNENLEELIQKGMFREDLYYRLNVVKLECPPLRFRKNDIVTIAKQFILRQMKNTGKYIDVVEDGVWDALTNYDWPGNIRELENAIESSVVLCDGSSIRVSDLPIKIQNARNINNNKGNKLYEISQKEQEVFNILAALERNGGHREKTARELGISRRTLQYKLKYYNIK